MGLRAALRAGLRAGHRIGLLAGLLAGLAGPAGELAAQTTVVLGSGGSRGLAHAGVLLGLEEEGYGIDAVVGVSMGAVVGSLYASGMSPADVWRLVESNDWRQLFAPLPVSAGPPSAFAGGMAYPFVRVELPTSAPRIGGLVSDARINLELSRRLFDAEVRAGGDFDRLPRRFRAVAARLSDGEPVVFRRGSLARAVRASMAVPGFFSPVTGAGGELLVDGGIADYLPVGLGRALAGEPPGGGFVVAVDVLRPPAEHRPATLVESATRSLRLLLRAARIDTATPDLLIVPDIPPDLSGALFPVDPLPLLEAGRRAARTAAWSAAQPAAQWPPAASRPPTAQEPRPAPARLEGLVLVAPASLHHFLQAALSDATAGPYDPEAVLRATAALYDTGLFSAVWPGVAPRPAGPPALEVRVEPEAPVLVVGAAAYDRDRGSGGWARLRGWTVTGPVALEPSVAGALHRLDRWAAAELRLLHAAALPWALRAGGHVRSRHVRTFGDSLDPGSVLRAGGQLGVERTLGDLWRAELALVAERIEARGAGAPAAGMDGAPGEDVAAAGVGARVRIARTPPLVQTIGLPLQLEAESRSGPAGHRRLHLSGSHAFALGPLRLAPLADLALASDDAPADVLPALGDHHLVPGLRYQERRAPVRVVLGLDLAVPIPLEGTARLLTRAGATGVVPEEALRGRWVAGSEIGVQWWTPFGPVEIGWGVNSAEGSALRLRLGPVF